MSHNVMQQEIWYSATGPGQHKAEMLACRACRRLQLNQWYFAAVPKLSMHATLKPWLEQACITTTSKLRMQAICKALA